MRVLDSAASYDLKVLSFRHRWGEIMTSICRVNAALFLLAGSVPLASPAFAQSRSEVALRIAPQPLAGALNEFARQSRQQLLFKPKMVIGKRSNGLSGSYSPEQGLKALLDGSGLSFRATGRGVFVVTAMASQAQAGPSPAAADRAAAPRDTAGAVPTDALPPVTDQEIIVTAQRRSESIQRVPATITAFSGEALEARGIETTADLQLRTPGFVMSSNVVFGQPFLRGSGNATLTIGSDSSVATHLDGVYLTRPMSTFQELFDVERVEVLKGPQGTLYGRNATGGVINIITADPTDVVEGKAEVTVGNYGKRKFAASLSGPLTGDDTLSGRVTVMRSKHDGYVRNIFDGSRLEDEDVVAARAKIRLRLSDSARLTLAGDWLREDDTRGHGLKAVIPGAGSSGTVIPADPHEVNKDYEARTFAKMSGISLTGEFSVLGAQLKTITARRHSEFNLALDLDLSSRPFANVDPETESSNTFTQEVQVSSPRSGPFEWVAGAFYLHEDARTQFNIHLTQAGINQTPTGFNETDAYAVYGQGSLSVASKLRFTAGARYSHERKRGRVITNFPPPTQTSEGTDSWNALTPHFDVNFFPTEKVMLYASATRGFKSGGFNATARGLPRFDPEFIWSYEGGVKSTLADGKLRANASIFRYNYRDLQVRALVSGIISGVTNAAKATVQGAEVEFSARPAAGLTLDLAGAYLDAKFDDFPTTNPDISPTAAVNLRGNRLPRAPEWTVTAGAGYTFGLGNSGSLLTRVDWQFQSRTFFDEFNEPTRSQKPFSTLAARVAWTSADQRWSAALWGRNLTDVDYITNALRSAGTYGTAHHYAPPRPFGITLGARL
jgi:iron complex outermembrane receptor protein